MNDKKNNPELTPVRFYLRILRTMIVLCIVPVLFIYPLYVTTVLIFDKQLRETGQSRFVASWFEGATGRYLSYTDDFLKTGYAESVSGENVAGTEWPMFGSVFYLLTAEELMKSGEISINQAEILDAVEKAALIITDPVTATWVRQQWGTAYLETENVFYRMLLIMGISSYEQITGKTMHHELLESQCQALATELTSAPLLHLDDYPGECYPNDVLWAVAAIKRSKILDSTQIDTLTEKLMAVLDSRLKTNGLPAFQINADTGEIIQESRGCGNSGILPFAGELNFSIARSWYSAYEDQFWQDSGWVAGFREHPRGSTQNFIDVDSGPVVFGFGSVAMTFGIGAANTFGRFDHSVPMTLEMVSASWPTPFGFLIPGLMGWLAAGGWCLGEMALLFSMTRPNLALGIVPFDGSVPGVIWIIMAIWGSLSIFYAGREIRYWIRFFGIRSSSDTP